MAMDEKVFVFSLSLDEVSGETNSSSLKNQFKNGFSSDFYNTRTQVGKPYTTEAVGN